MRDANRRFASNFVRDTLAAVRVVTFESERGESVGALVGGDVVDLAELLPGDTSQAMLEALIDGFADLRDAIDTLPTRPVTEVRLRASVPDAGQGALRHAQPAGARGRDAPPYAYLKYAGGGVGNGEALRLPAGESSLCFAPRSPSSSAVRCATSPRRLARRRLRLHGVRRRRAARVPLHRGRGLVEVVGHAVRGRPGHRDRRRGPSRRPRAGGDRVIGDRHRRRPRSPAARAASSPSCRAS